MSKTVPQNVAGYIVCGSHRARSKALGVIGRDVQAYHLSFTASDMSHKGIYPATREQLLQCRTIKGIRGLPRAKEGDLSPCWSFES